MVRVEVNTCVPHFRNCGSSVYEADTTYITHCSSIGLLKPLNRGVKAAFLSISIAAVRRPTPNTSIFQLSTMVTIF